MANLALSIAIASWKMKRRVARRGKRGEQPTR